MLYHYTSIQALEGILRESPSEKGLCFWASRYDCFGDKEEYKIGIETIKALLPKVENRLQSDRQVASSFDWNNIKENIFTGQTLKKAVSIKCCPFLMSYH